MNDPAIAEITAQALADAKTLNVTKTPGYFVNGKPLQTFGYRQLQQLIQSEIAATYPNQQSLHEATLHIITASQL